SLANFDMKIIPIAGTLLIYNLKITAWFQRAVASVLKIELILINLLHMRKVLEDNYSYLVVDDATKEEPTKVLEISNAEGVTIKHLLTTHHHPDHSGGNTEFVKQKPGIKVYGGDDRIPEITEKLTHEQEFKIGNNINVRTLHTPCHTTGSISYYLTDISDDNQKAVFTGDTLFIGGCGRFFEGTGQDMHTSLNQILGSLPPETKVYCGHEYTESNLQFALSVDPNNQALKNKISWVESGGFGSIKDRPVVTVPSTIGGEKDFNPFMRVDSDAIKKAVQEEDPVETISKLRELKNNF
ncbi:1381_t:CDS:2, partial [Ambispora leptoticha]